jgi:hypothetical protein
MVKICNYTKESKAVRQRRLSRERMKIFRAKKSQEKGREPHKNGRSKMLLNSEGDYIYSRICTDSSKGIFHQIRWLIQLVKDLHYVRNDSSIPSRSWAYSYIKKSASFRLRKPTVTERKRILSCTGENLRKFYSLVASKYKQNVYNCALKFNVDETPLLIKHPESTSVIVPKDSLIVPTEEPVPFIFKCSAVPVVSSDGTHLCSAIIFPEDYDLTMLENRFRLNFVIYKTKRGSMTKNLFEKFMKEEVITRIGLKIIIIFIFFVNIIIITIITIVISYVLLYQKLFRRR